MIIYLCKSKKDNIEKIKKAMIAFIILEIVFIVFWLGAEVIKKSAVTVEEYYLDFNNLIEYSPSRKK